MSTASTFRRSKTQESARQRPLVSSGVALKLSKSQLLDPASLIYLRARLGFVSGDDYDSDTMAPWNISVCLSLDYL